MNNDEIPTCHPDWVQESKPVAQYTDSSLTSEQLANINNPDFTRLQRKQIIRATQELTGKQLETLSKPKFEWERIALYRVGLRLKLTEEMLLEVYKPSSLWDDVLFLMSRFPTYGTDAEMDLFVTVIELYITKQLVEWVHSLKPAKPCKEGRISRSRTSAFDN